ncbi:MAG: hypothetical protein QNJ55_26525 [Xenococcus sp. MO_188.B8]|nr:hypothetical protein [Xenococcus sp. MO_188.B8]
MDIENINLENWMETCYPILQDLPITDIVIPGVHHPASYSFMTGKTGKFVTQNTNIYQQLTAGIRYFDSRPAKYEDQENKIFEYHGGKRGDDKRSYGASYNTLLRQFRNYFDGYNTLVSYGSSPNVLSLAENKFAILYHSKRIFNLSTDGNKNETVFSTQLYYRVGEFEEATNQIKWREEQAYNYGQNPDAVVTQNGTIVEVHKSENNDNLWYTIGKIINDIPTFDLRLKGKYTTGVQPSLGIIKKQDHKETDYRELILEVHKSENNNGLFYYLFELSKDESTLETINSGKVICGETHIEGEFIKQLSLPNCNKSLLFFNDANKNLYFVMAELQENTQKTNVQFSEPIQIPDIKGNNVSTVLMSQPVENQFEIALSYNTTTVKGNTVRSYTKLLIDENGEIIDPFPETNFKDEYLTWNAQSAALYNAGNNKLLSFESDDDLLHNIWYQPIKINESTFEQEAVESSQSQKKKEFTILSLSHSDLSQTDAEYLQKIFEHFLPNLTVPNDSITLNKDSLSSILDQSYQMIVLFDIEDTDIEISKENNVFWNTQNSFSNPWHKEKKLDSKSKYYEKIYQYIIDRPNDRNKIYVLQSHLTENNDYSTLLNWDRQYEPIANAYLMSQSNLMIENNINVIESNMLTPFLTQFSIKLNEEKYRRRTQLSLLSVQLE